MREGNRADDHVHLGQRGVGRRPRERDLGLVSVHDIAGRRRDLELYAGGILSGSVFVPKSPSRLEVTTKLLVTEALATAGAALSYGYVDLHVFAYPPRCYSADCRFAERMTLASSPLGDLAPATLPPGSTREQTLTVTPSSGQSLPKGHWRIQSVFVAWAGGLQRPGQDASAAGGVDVTSITTTVGS